MIKGIAYFFLLLFSFPGYASNYYARKEMKEHQYKIFNVCMEKCSLDKETQNEMRELYRKSSDIDNKYYYVSNRDTDSDLLLYMVKVFATFWAMMSIALLIVFFLTGEVSWV
jgi:hypothetical protein